MATSLFPKEMLSTSLSIDIIKAKLTWFELQFHELHWQTFGLGVHQAIGDAYDTVFDLKDEIVEQMMGYSNTRVKTTPVDPIKNYSEGLPLQIVSECINFAKQLQDFGKANNMPGIENLSQDLSGKMARIKYRLTQS